MKSKLTLFASVCATAFAAFTFSGCDKNGALSEKSDKIRIDLDFTQDSDTTISFNKPDFMLWDTPELKFFKDKRDKIEGFEIDSISLQFTNITGVADVYFGGLVEILNKDMKSSYKLSFCDLTKVSVDDTTDTTIVFPKVSDFTSQKTLFAIFSALDSKLQGEVSYTADGATPSVCSVPATNDCIKNFYQEIAKELVKTDTISFNSSIRIRKLQGFLQSGRLSIRIHFKGKFPSII
jgi:hypothetical protein